MHRKREANKTIVCWYTLCYVSELAGHLSNARSASYLLLVCLNAVYSAYLPLNMIS